MMRQIILFLFMLSSLFSQFVWDEDGVKIRQGVHTEWQRTATVGFENEMIFIWSDTRYGGRDIYAQKVDETGNPLWTEQGTPVVLSEGRQEDPLAVSDRQGGVYIAWIDYRNEPEKGDVYAQHVLTDGSLAWNEDGVALSSVEGAQTALNMCVDGLGGAFVIWIDQSELSGINGQIYSTHISYDGEILSPGTGVPVVTNDGEHTTISLENAGDGFAMMVWRDTRIAEEKDIYAQRIDTICSPLWSTLEEGGIPLSAQPGIKEIAPKVTHVVGDTTVVVWEDYRNNPTSGDVYIQYLDGEGNMLLDPNGATVCDDPTKQSKPRVKADAESAYIVWTDFRLNGFSGDIYAQRYTLEEGAQWENSGKPICTANGKQTQPRLTVDNTGSVFMTWMDERNAPHPEEDIFLQHIHSDGTLSFAENGLGICEEVNLQESPIVRMDQHGGVFVLWSDWRMGSPGMYVQHISQDMEISLAPNGEEIYFGIDGDAIAPKTLYIEDDRVLIYWEDNRLGGENPQIYGQLVSRDFHLSGEYNGVPLSENPKQTKPKAVTVGDHIFLNFQSEDEWGTVIQYYQVLNHDLSMVGDPNGTPIFTVEYPSNQEYSELTVDEMGYVYCAFSDVRETWDQDVYVQKYDEFGVPQWQDGGILLYEFAEYDYVQALEPLPGGGCVAVWYGGPWNNLNIYAKALNGDGVEPEEWPSYPLVVTEAEGHQETISAISTPNGVFVVWKDARSANADIFGLVINFDGTTAGAENGFVIVEKENDQLNPSMMLNTSEEDVFLCWEDYQSGQDYDIVCTSVNLSTLETSEEFAFVELPRNQQSPSIEGIDDTYIAVWQDSPDSSTADIYMQTWNGTEFGYGNSGLPVCDISFDQVAPTITKLSDEDGTFLMVWEDNRSSGKNQLKNIYAQVLDFTVNATDENPVLPNEMALYPNFPNPFNPVTVIRYAVPTDGMVDITIYDALGRKVNRIVSDRKSAGNHQTVWTGADQHGRYVSSGVYFCKITTNGQSQTRKMSLMR